MLMMMRLVHQSGTRSSETIPSLSELPQYGPECIISLVSPGPTFPVPYWD